VRLVGREIWYIVYILEGDVIEILGCNMHLAQLRHVILIFEDFVGCVKFFYPGCILVEGILLLTIFSYINIWVTCFLCGELI
jgi:hypothetical protein